MVGAGELVRRAWENRRGAVRASEASGERPRAAALESELEARDRRDASAAGPGIERARQMDCAQAARPQRGAGSRPAPQPHHEAYSALMRSHDRMRTRHLPVQGGEGRA